MGRALPTTMLWFLSLTLSLLVFANGTVTTFSLILCHVKHSSVGLRINTGDGDWLERPPYPAATGKDSTVWSVSMPPTPPPPTGGWVGNGNVPYNGNPCAVERSNQGFIIISGAEGTIGATATQSWVCLAPPASFGRVTTTNFVWTAAPPPPNALVRVTVRFLLFSVLFTSALFKPRRVRCSLPLPISSCEGSRTPWLFVFKLSAVQHSHGRELA